EVAAACSARGDVEHCPQLVEAELIYTVLTVGIKITCFAKVIHIIERNTDVRLSEEAEARGVSGDGAEVASKCGLRITQPFEPCGCTLFGLRKTEDVL